MKNINLFLLALIIIVANIIFIPISYLITNYIRNSSSSLFIDFSAIGFWFFLIFCLSFLESILLNNVLFSKRRKTVIELEKDENITMQLPKSFTFQKSLFFVLFLILNFFLINAINKNFWFGYYSKGGIYKTNLRSKNPEKVLWSLRKISSIHFSYIRDFLPLVEEQINNPSAVIKMEAILTIGKIARRMQRSVDILKNKAELRNKWELELLIEIREKYAEKFLNMLVRENKVFIPEISYALGAMREKKALSFFESYFFKENFDYETTKKIALAIADIKDSEGLEIIQNILLRSPSEIQSILFFAAGEIILHSKLNDKKVEKFISFVKKNLSSINFYALCSFMESFLKIRDIRFTDTLIDIYDLTPDNMICRRLEIKYPDDYPQAIVTHSLLKLKILDSLAMISIGNKNLKIWFEKKFEDKSENEIFRNKIKKIIEVLKKSEQFPIDG